MRSFFLLLGLLLQGVLPGHSQCSVDAGASPSTIDCEATVDIVADGIAGDSIMYNDFNDSTLGSGWSANLDVAFDDPCVPTKDTSSYAWVGPEADEPRFLETIDYDLSCGGRVCFDLRMASQGNPSPCEGPDLPDEGVNFEYSTDGGANWNTIQYFNPDTNGTSGSGNMFNSWDNYCFDIPSAAVTPNTRFRWYQGFVTDTTFDHWGIDDVTIIQKSCNNYYYDWKHVAGSPNDSDQTVNVSSDTSFQVLYTDGATDTCSATVSVSTQMDVTATTDQYKICKGNSVNLTSSLNTSSIDSIDDDFDPGINGSMWDTIVGGSANTNCGSMSGNALHFDNSDPREAVTAPLNTNNCSSISFCLVFGGGSSPCEDADSGEDVEFQYSTDGGVTWNTINTYTTPTTSWTCYNISLPAGAQGVGVQFRWHQIGTFGSTIDHWALDNVSMSCTPTSYNYSWTPSASLASPNDSTTVATPDSTTIYTSRVEKASDPTCFETDTVKVVVDSAQANVAQPDTINCSNTSVTIDGSASYTTSGSSAFNWTTSTGNITSGGSSSSATVDEAGSYTLTVTETGLGCTDDTTVNVAIDTASPQAVVAQPDTLTCSKTSVTLDGTASTSKNGHVQGWSTGDSTATITVSTAGNYTLTVKDTGNGCTHDTTVTVAIDTASPQAVVAQPDTLTCSKTSVTLDGTASTSKNGHVQGWSTGDSTATITVSTAGNYTLTVKDTGNGCTHDTTVAVAIDTVAPTISIAQPDTFFCSTNSVTLDASASTTNSGSKSFSWSSLSGTINSGGNTATPTVGAAGDYELVLTDPENGCVAIDTVTVQQEKGIPTADIALPDTLTCNVASVTLDASASTTNSGNKDFGWSTSSGNIVNAAADSSWIEVDAASSYTVTVTDPDNGCSDNFSVAVPADTVVPTAIVSQPDTLTCSNTSVSLDGSSSTSKSGNKNYSWSNGLSGSSITVTNGGNYTLTVTDPDNGCTHDTTVTVPVDSAQPTAVVPLPDTITCSNNSATVDASGSSSNSGSLSYSWSTTNGNITSGTGSAAIDVDQSGSYDLTLTDPANGCSYDTTAVVHVDSIAPSISIAPPDTFYCTTSSVTLDAIASTTNSGKKSYSWTAVSGSINSGGNTANPTIGSAGDYALTLTDPANGCVSIDTITVPQDNNIPTVNLAPIDTLTCAKNTVTVDASASTTNSGNKDFSWSSSMGNIVSAPADSSSVAVDVSANYTVTVTDPANGCTNSSTVSVPIDTVSPAPFVAEPDTLTCSKTSVTLDASGSTSNSGNKSYSWSNGDSGPTTSVSNAGNHTVTVTDPGNGCSYDTTVTVPIDTVSPAPIVKTPDTLTCSVGSVTLDATASTSNSGNKSYSWSNGDSGPTTSVSSAGNVALTVTDPVNGCSHDTTVMVPIDTVTPTPVVATPDTLTCTQTSVTLDASASASNSGSKTYSWSNGDSGPTASVSSPGSYSVTVTDPNNGCSDDTTLSVVEAGKPSITVDSVVDASCNGTCDGGVHISVNGGSAPYSYSWNDPSGQTTQDATGLCAGDVIVTVTDDNGCEVKDTMTVGEPAPLQVSTVPDTTICINGTATLSANASGGTPGYTYQWDNGLGSGQVKTVSPSNTTVYTVYAEDANGCSSAPKTVRVELHPALQVTVSSDKSVCPGDSVQLTATGSGGIGSGYSYSWSNGASGSSITVSPSKSTDYGVTLEDGCETPAVTDSVRVTVDPLPDVQIGGQDLKGCEPVDATLVNATDPSMVGGTCDWQLGDGTNSTSCDTVSHIYDEPGCYDVTLSVTSPDGCVDSTTLTDYVCVRPYPKADFRFNPKSTTVQDPSIEFTNMSTGAYDYQWNFAGNDTIETEHPSYEFPNDGAASYDVCLNATSPYGCKDSICKTVNIDGEFILYVPNAFTPDGDGINDKFGPVVQGADRKDYTFTIYDRWGEVVFESNHPEKKWDGSIKGDVSEGKTDVYVWRLETKNKYTGKEIVKRGHVTLIR